MPKQQTEFTVHGPFEIPLENGRGGPDLDVSAFWRSDDVAALARRSGCYVFALQKVKGTFVPHYVGLTGRAFVEEVFNPSNRPKYQRAMGTNKRHRPFLFLITPTRRGAKVSKKYIPELESFLIQAGSTINPEIRNVKGVKRPNWFIRGVTGRRPGKRSAPARKLRTAMGLLTK